MGCCLPGCVVQPISQNVFTNVHSGLTRGILCEMIIALAQDLEKCSSRTLLNNQNSTFWETKFNLYPLEDYLNIDEFGYDMLIILSYWADPPAGLLSWVISVWSYTSVKGKNSNPLFLSALRYWCIKSIIYYMVSISPQKMFSHKTLWKFDDNNTTTNCKVTAP